MANHYGHIADQMKRILEKVIMKNNFERFYDLNLP